MKKYILLGIILILGMIIPFSGFAQIIPNPTHLELGKDKFVIDENISLHYNSDETDLALIFIDQLQKHTGICLNKISVPKRKAGIYIIKENSSEYEEENYSLNIKEGKIELRAGTDAGLFYGIQTLLQLSISSEKDHQKIILPTVHIEDNPLFMWRGLMLDESRHFFGKEKVKQLLDWMAFFKLNKFHWHLTDEPGWRLEIKKYPKLGSLGGQGNWSNPEAPVNYYTQDDIIEIVQYAKERYIEVIPEIDMPGHATAANKAYPEYSGGGSEKHPEFTFHPAKDSTYQYLTDILREVSALFPSKWIHIGGDEVHYGNQQWNSDPQVIELMKSQGFENLKDVENYFINRMSDTIISLNKKMFAWDEVVDAHIPNDHTAVMWWRHDKPQQLTKALDRGYNTVLCPRIPLYYDFVQIESHQWGRKWGDNYCNLEKVYSFPENIVEIPEKYKKQIMGIQANVWTEKIQNENRFDFMIYPRIIALAEASWTQEENKDYTSFLERLIPKLGLLDKEGIYYFNPFYPEQTPEPAGVNK